MMSLPLVSILIPCYNAEPYLAETVRSAMAQTWPNKEIIIVDDGSSDDSLAMALGFERDDVRVYTQRNLGAAAARNHAIRQSRGDYLQFLDADDLLAPDKIQLQMEEILSDPWIKCCATGMWGRFDNDPARARFTPQPTWCTMSPTDLLTILYREHRMVHPAAWLVPREIAEEAGPWDESLTLDDDGEYFCRIALACEEIKYVDGARSYYRSGLPSSLSGRKSEKAWDSQFRSIEYSSVQLLKVLDTPEIRRACANRFQRFVYTVYPDVPELRDKAEQWIERLGGTRVEPEGGPMFRAARCVLGWRGAKLLQRAVENRRRRKRESVRRSPSTSLGLPVN